MNRNNNQQPSQQNQNIQMNDLKQEQTPPILERAISRHDEVFLDPVNDYNSCCSSRTTDRRLIIMLSQIIFSMFVMLFAFYKLSDNDNNDDSKLYLPLVSSVLSYWIARGSNSNFESQ